MQGLPTQLLSKSSKTEVFGDKKASVKTEAGVTVDGKTSEGKTIDGAGSGSIQKGSENFASLFATLTEDGKVAKKPSGVQSETGEALKNLLNEINKDGSLKAEIEANVEAKQQVNPENVLANKIKNTSDDSKESNPKSPEVLLSLVSGEGKAKEGHNTKTVEDNLEQKITKSSSNLEQLLNDLRKNKNSEESSDSEMNDPSSVEPNKKNKNQIKTENTSQNPLEFLMSGAKNKTISENSSPTTEAPKDLESILGQKKVMTGEDYLKNMESTDKKAPSKLVLLNGLADLPKNNIQNVKGYGQGLSLLSDPLIKNTKDLAFKEGKKGNSTSAIEELRTPDTKIGSELSAIKQDVIPGMQNTKNNHEQQADTQTQANQKVLDLGKINTSNNAEIIKRISDYVEQNQVANRSSLDLTVKHESLGEFKIQVSKMPNQSTTQTQGLVDMQITTSSKEGHDFFVKNEVSLMKNLNQAGINLSDLRIISSMSEATPFGQSDSKQSSSFSQNSDGSSKQFNSFESSNFSSDSRGGSERRKELWDEYQQRYGA